MKKIISRDRGFTLVELMVTIAIVGLVSAIAIGGYLGWKPGYVFRGAVSQVRGDLNRAKMRAVETRRQCRVVFSTNGYRIDDGDQVMNSGVWVPSRVVRLSDFPLVTLTNLDDSAIVAGAEPIVTFSPRGTAVQNSFKVLYDNNTAGAVTVAVNITGRVNITWP